GKRDDRVAPQPRPFWGAGPLGQSSGGRPPVGNRHEGQRLRHLPIHNGGPAIDPRPPELPPSIPPPHGPLVSGPRPRPPQPRPPSPLSSRISASTVGRPRESQTRRPMIRSMRASAIDPPTSCDDDGHP